MNIKAVLFDLDGTLADTAVDLVGALNAVLREKGLPEKSLDDMRQHAGHGTGTLLKLGANILPDDPDFEIWRQAYLAQYALCCTQNVALFEGVNELIGEIVARGLKWGIITNKPARFTESVLPKLNLIVPPDVVVSGDTCGEAKPSVKPMLYACEQIQIQPENCFYVGDAARDMVAGKGAGMHTVLAEWGYISPTDDDTETWLWDFSIQQPLDILHLLDTQNNREGKADD